MQLIEEEIDEEQRGIAEKLMEVMAEERLLEGIV